MSGGQSLQRGSADGPVVDTSQPFARAEYLENRFTWTQVALRRVSRNDYPEQGFVVGRADAAPETERLVKAA